VTIPTTENSKVIGISSERADREKQLVLSQTPSATQQLCRALREFPGEAGALGATWTTREKAEHQAAQFCHAARADDVELPTGEYHARAFELAGKRWGVVVWYACVLQR